MTTHDIIYRSLITVTLTMAASYWLMIVLLAYTYAAEIVTKDGNILLIVDSSDQTVSIATKAEYTSNGITPMHKAVTMVRLLTPLYFSPVLIVLARVQGYVQAMLAELRIELDGAIANVSTSLDEYKIRVQVSKKGACLGVVVRAAGS
jgi:hypothetical protein